MEQKKNNEETRNDDNIRKFKAAVFDRVLGGLAKPRVFAFSSFLIGIFAGLSGAVVLYFGLPDQVSANRDQLATNTAAITELKEQTAKISVILETSNTELSEKLKTSNEQIENRLRTLDGTINTLILTLQ